MVHHSLSYESNSEDDDEIVAFASGTTSRTRNARTLQARRAVAEDDDDDDDEDVDGVDDGEVSRASGKRPLTQQRRPSSQLEQQHNTKRKPD